MMVLNVDKAKVDEVKAFLAFLGAPTGGGNLAALKTKLKGLVTKLEEDGKKPDA